MIFSVIDDRCDVRVAFSRIIQYYDPNKSKNRKTKVLDFTNAYRWVEKQAQQLYNITSTRNLGGIPNKKDFDIIIYEPVRDKKFYTMACTHSGIFKKILSNRGLVLVRASDFRVKGKSQLMGSYEVQKAFIENGYYLSDKIIYRHQTQYNDCEFGVNEVKLVHSYFMVFRIK